MELGMVGLDKMPSALRYELGGHLEKPAAAEGRAR